LISSVIAVKKIAGYTLRVNKLFNQRGIAGMADKKWFTTEDIEVAKMALDELPDLKEKRLTKSDVLEKLKEQIITLSTSKGYSVEDIRSALETAGVKTSTKAIREILSTRKKPTAGAGGSRVKRKPEDKNSTESGKVE